MTRQRARIPNRVYAPLLFHPAASGTTAVGFDDLLRPDDTRPLTVELGVGGGEWIRGAAAHHPERRYVAVEAVPLYAYRLRDQLLPGKPDSRDNLWVVHGDGRLVVTDYLPARSIDQLVLLFPDPWPKKRHHKRRLITPAMAAWYLRALDPGGAVRFRTDQPRLFYDGLSAFLQAGFEIETWEVNDKPSRALTAWEMKAISQGLKVAEVRLRRGTTVSDPDPQTLERIIDPRQVIPQATYWQK